MVEETEARTRLMCVWVNLSAKPTFKKGKKKKTIKKKKSNKFWTVFNAAWVGLMLPHRPTVHLRL